jgi:ribonuclease BN (tRNA processing enzyme)
MAQGSRTTSFLLDDDVLIDAGTGVGDLSLEEMVRIEHILVTHSHLDHVLSIGLLADNVLRHRRGKPPVTVHCLAPTLAALRAHIFNGVIWPDFSVLPTPEAPTLSFETFEVGAKLDVGSGRVVEVLSAVHQVPAVGFALHGTNGAWVFTGDTGPNDALWAWAQRNPIKHLVIETAFGDEEAEIARLSGHLHPEQLGTQLAKLPAHSKEASIHITHIKPGEVDSVMKQVRALRWRDGVRALAVGDLMTV